MNVHVHVTKILIFSVLRDVLVQGFHVVKPVLNVLQRAKQIFLGLI